MEITLFAENKPGVLYKASLVFKNHGYKIKQKQQKVQNNSSHVLYSFFLSGNGNSDGLMKALISIDYVIDVEIIEQDVADITPETSLQSRETLLEELILVAQAIIYSYPNFVAVVQEAEQNSEISEQNLLELGQFVGQGLLEQGIIKQVRANNLSSGIKKLVLPTVERFAIAEAQNNQLLIYANPFCLKKTSDEPSCYFLKGMIKGLLQSIGKLPEFTVNETSCKATGADCCTFTIIY